MVNITFTDKDLRVVFDLIKSGVIFLDDEGALQRSSEMAITTANNELKEGEAVYKTSDIEALNNQNDELRNKLQEMVNAYESLKDSFVAMEKENQQLKEEARKMQNVESVQDSSDYKELVASNTLLEATTSRLTKENEELKARLQNASSENNSQEVAELKERLSKAVEVFKQQEKEIESLKSGNSGVDIEKLRVEIETECKARANAALAEQWNKLVEKKDKELEDKVKELSELQKMEREQLQAEIKELEKNSKDNAEGVPFGLESFVNKAMPMIERFLNPQQASGIEAELKRFARDLTECYASDYQDSKKENKENEKKAASIVSQATETKKEKATTTESNVAEANFSLSEEQKVEAYNKFEQDDLPF